MSIEKHAEKSMHIERIMQVNTSLTGQKKGVLYIVATPIGNLEDISLRAIRVLKEVHLIAAEDTRRTKKLLSAYQINTPMTSLYEQNERKKRGMLVAKMNEGYDCAYVSDAGTPGISDPGYLLVQEALAQAIAVVPIPGACAAIAALSVSGLPMDRFVFFGFLPAKAGRRRQFLKSVAQETKTMIFYESPNRLKDSLSDIQCILGSRMIVVTRELTKIYEEIFRGPVREVIETVEKRTLKGEITLVVGGKEQQALTCPEEAIRALIAQYETLSLSKRDLIDRIAGELNVPRNSVYRAVMNAKDT